MENYTKQLTDNIYLKKVEKEERTYYIMTTYYNYEDPNKRMVTNKKDFFINEQTFKELEKLTNR